MRRLVCLSFSLYCRALVLTVLLGFGAALLPGGTAAVWALTPSTPNAANTPAAPEEPVPDVSQLQAQLAELPTSAATDEAMGSLMDQINATSDQKAVQEIQARIGAENALLAHEVSQVQMLQGMADSEERIARSRERERQYQMLARTGKVADYLP